MIFYFIVLGRRKCKVKNIFGTKNRWRRKKEKKKEWDPKQEPPRCEPMSGFMLRDMLGDATSLDID